jgi:hypothetical protein
MFDLEKVLAMGAAVYCLGKGIFPFATIDTLKPGAVFGHIKDLV